MYSATPQKNISMVHKEFVPGENRTPVPATTMRDTNHYTTETNIMCVTLLHKHATLTTRTAQLSFCHVHRDLLLLPPSPILLPCRIIIFTSRQMIHHGFRNLQHKDMHVCSWLQAALPDARVTWLVWRLESALCVITKMLISSE